MARKQRMLYVDNLRLSVIVLVVAMHAAVTYSGLGSWYYKEGLPLDPASRLVFAVFQCFLQAFFMGTLFMLAGYYAAASLESRGTWAFIKGRLMRLGLPSLFYMAAINPVMVYFLKVRGIIEVPFFRYYREYLLGPRLLAGSGPMWFALALLGFCVAYALVLAAGPPFAPRSEARGLAARTILALALAASLGAFALRLAWPIGTSVLNMQLCYFSQYVLLFLFGIAAHANGWLESIDFLLARRCLFAALLGITALPVLFFATGALAGHREIMGGWNWQSLAFSLWESFTGVLMSVGLAGYLRERWNTQGGFTKGLTDSSFAVYVFHPPILVFISWLMRPVGLPALPKFLLVFAVAVPSCFAAARVIRATPLLRALVRS